MRRSNVLLVIGAVAVGLLAVLFVSRATYRPAPAQRGKIRVAGQPRPGSLRETDPNGVSWLLEMTSGPRLASADTDDAKAGPPVVVKTDVHRVAQREVSIGLVLEGQGGERFRPAQKNGRTVAAPRLRIVNEAGQVIADDSFQFG
jgi:hypothetical protein